MFRYGLPAIIWTIVVTVLTLLPGRDLPEVNIVNFDKAAHLGVFGLLTGLYLRWNNSLPVEVTRNILVTLFVIAYSGLIELLQGIFYVDRHADILDFAANATGCVLAFLLLQRFRWLGR